MLDRANGRNFYASNAGSASLPRYHDAEPARRLHSATPDRRRHRRRGRSSDGRNLYVQAGANGIVDAFGIGSDGRCRVGTVTVPAQSAAKESSPADRCSLLRSGPPAEGPLRPYAGPVSWPGHPGGMTVRRPGGQQSKGYSCRRVGGAL